MLLIKYKDLKYFVLLIRYDNIKYRMFWVQKW